MNEVSEIKNAWKKSAEKNLDTFYYSQTELESIFQMKTLNYIKSVNRKLRIDGILMMLTLLVFIALLFIYDFESKAIDSLLLSIIGISMLAFSRIKFVWLRLFVSREQSVTEMIRGLINRITFFTKLYLTGFPALAGLLFITYKIKVFYLHNGHWLFNSDFFIGLWPLPFLILGIFFLTRWILNNTYLNHLDELNSSYKQLAEC